jgi:hypothetical protein
MLLDFWQGSRTPLRDPLARGTSLRPDATP